MAGAAQQAFVRSALAAPEPPPLAMIGPLGWLRQRLFDSVLNTVLTVLSATLLVALVWPTVRFLLIDAVWTGSDRTACLAETVGRPVGACWPFIAAKFNQFMYGFYPESEQWRVNVTYALGLMLLVPLLIPRCPLQAHQRHRCSSACFRWSRSSCWSATCSDCRTSRPGCGAAFWCRW